MSHQDSVYQRILHRNDKEKLSLPEESDMDPTHNKENQLIIVYR